MTPGVMQQPYSLVNTETRERILYPVDDAYEVEVDEDMSSMFHAIEVPTHDADFDAALRWGPCTS
jgi:hypothetical protein